MEQDSSSMEKRFSYKFLKRLLKNVDSAQEFIAHLGKFAAFLYADADVLFQYCSVLKALADIGVQHR